MKEPTVYIIKYDEFHNYEFKPPCKYFFRDALDNYIFISGTNRLKAQNWINSNYGVGKYKVGSIQ